MTSGDDRGGTIVWNGIVGSVEDAAGPGRSGGPGLDRLAARRDRQGPDLGEPGLREPDPQLEERDRDDDEGGVRELAAR